MPFMHYKMWITGPFENVSFNSVVYLFMLILVLLVYIFSFTFMFWCLIFFLAKHWKGKLPNNKFYNCFFCNFAISEFSKKCNLKQIYTRANKAGNITKNALTRRTYEFINVQKLNILNSSFFDLYI